MSDLKPSRKRPESAAGELRNKYIHLVQRFNTLVQAYTKNRSAFKRLLANYSRLRNKYLILHRHSTKRVRELLSTLSQEKYPIVFDEYRALISVSEDFLSEIEMERLEFSRSIYVDVLFDHYLPEPDRAKSSLIIQSFQFPIMLKNYQNAGDYIHPFVHFIVSGKISFDKDQRKYVYFLNIENISSSVELDYFQKTDTLISKLSLSNFKLLNAKKAIEMHKIMLITLTTSLVGEYSRETSMHLKNMQYLTSYLSAECKRLGLIKVDNYDLDDYVKDINYTSVLHDIGKMATPREILEKDTALSPAEVAQVRRHPETGAAYIQNIIDRFANEPVYERYINFLSIPYEICLYHHERWDGSGYPKGLQGEAIPIAARIISVVDTYEALRGVRTYNVEKKTHLQAVQVIKGQAGRQFDPRIVKAFLSIHYKFDDVYAGLRDPGKDAGLSASESRGTTPVSPKAMDTETRIELD